MITFHHENTYSYNLILGFYKCRSSQLIEIPLEKPCRGCFKEFKDIGLQDARIDRLFHFLEIFLLNLLKASTYLNDTRSILTTEILNQEKSKLNKFL